jgi:cytochrome b pre-mRNA-processing protein 3
LSVLSRIFGNPHGERARLRPLYDAVVREARSPAWYRDGGVPDTIDGRFDMVSAILALALLRLEQDGDATKREVVLITEIFIDDMDGTLRQLGIGDIVVGKRIGKMMGALGGRLGAFRDGFAGTGDLDGAVRRNIFRDAPPSDEAVAFVRERLEALHGRLLETPMAALLVGEIGR